MATHAIPDGYTCPILLEVMVDPVIAPDGHSYERHAIQRWLADGNTTSPYTGEPLSGNLALLPNHNLRKSIKEWRARHPVPSLDPSFLTLHEDQVLGEGSFGRVVAGSLCLGPGGRELAVAVKMLPTLR